MAINESMPLNTSTFKMYLFDMGEQLTTLTSEALFYCRVKQTNFLTVRKSTIQLIKTGIGLCILDVTLIWWYRSRHGSSSCDDGGVSEGRTWSRRDAECPRACEECLSMLSSSRHRSLSAT